MARPGSRRALLQAEKIVERGHGKVSVTIPTEPLVIEARQADVVGDRIWVEIWGEFRLGNGDHLLTLQPRPGIFWSVLIGSRSVHELR
jgi:hypothetical protein